MVAQALHFAGGEPRLWAEDVALYRGVKRGGGFFEEDEDVGEVLDCGEGEGGVVGLADVDLKGTERRCEEAMSEWWRCWLW